MGLLTFKNGRFYFSEIAAGGCNKTPPTAPSLAAQAAFEWDDNATMWRTRAHSKAVKLKAYADQAARAELGRYFIEMLPAPPRLVYPRHLKPMPHQMESARHALTRSTSYVADEAGLGKTITSVICMNSVPGRTLIICPPFLKYNWADEIEKWRVWDVSVGIVEGANRYGVINGADVVILPDSLLSSSDVLDAVKAQRFEWLFVDEAHRYKEATTKRTVALAGDESGKTGIIGSACRKVFLSGTPIPNGRPIELFALLSRAAPESVGYRDRIAFGQHFCGARLVQHGRGNSGSSSHWDTRGASNLSQLRQELREKLMIRHLKKDVLAELPAKSRKIIFLDQPKRLKSFEARVLKEYSLSELMGEDRSLGDIATYRREVGEAKIKPSAEFIRDWLDEHEDQKLVVFANHVSVIETLHQMLARYKPLMVRGGLTSKEKAAHVKRFQGSDQHRVIIGNMDAMGVGNTLTRAHTVMIIEPSWVPGCNEQAEDRVHRIGQTNTVYVKYLVLRDSLDERMLRQVLGKEENIRNVMS